MEVACPYPRACLLKGLADNYTNSLGFNGSILSLFLKQILHCGLVVVQLTQILCNFKYFLKMLYWWFWSTYVRITSNKGRGL